MGASTIKFNRKAFKKALGEDVANVLIDQAVRVSRHSEILNRGFFGRLKWLLTGR